MGGETRIQLCGRLVVRVDGRRVEDALPGRQGRLAFVYLAANRLRPVTRADLTDALWPVRPPAAVDSALAAILSKLRGVLGAGVLEGRREPRLALPPGAWIDLEAAGDAIHRAESAVARAEWHAAWAPGRIALHIAQRGFLPGEDAPWVEERRRRLADVLGRAHECVAAAGLGIGGAEIDAAIRSGRELIALTPHRESGYRLLMQALAARGNAAEALDVYEQLRRRLRDDLGVAPGDASQALHRSLLR